MWLIPAVFYVLLALDDTAPRERTRLYQEVHTPFSLDSFNAPQCRFLLRLSHASIRLVTRHLGCEFIVLPNRSRVPIEDAVCILLHRMAFPIRLEEMEIKFRRCHTVLSRTINYMVRFILDRFGHLLCLD